MIRRSLIGLFLIVGSIGVAQAVLTTRSFDRQFAARQANALTISGMVATATEITAAQEAYVAPGQPDEPWMARTGELIQQIRQAAAALEPQIAPAAARYGQDLSARLDALLAVDSQIQTHVVNGQDLSASDLIFTEARDAVGGIVSTIRKIDTADADVFGTARASNTQQLWTLLGASAGVWLFAAILWGRSAPRPATGPLEHGHITLAVQAVPNEPVAAEPAPLPMPTPSTQGSRVDLPAAADVCMRLSRLNAADALPDLLARAAGAVNASGVIMWLGAGQELFPVSAHGYEAEFLAQLGPIRRQARTAVASTWRSGQLSTVRGEGDEQGAIAAPMLNADGCFGVLTAEFRNHQETDAGVAAVMAMFSAQLSTIIPPWPAPSDALEESDRQDPPIAVSQ